MNNVSRIIKERCPNGVEYKKIKDVFTTFSGMTGVKGKWAKEGNCQFIDYMNVYKNIKIKTNILPYATVKSQNQKTLKQGDLLLTSASEVSNECAICSVIEEKIREGIFLDDHLFCLRLNNQYREKVNTVFICYYLNSKQFRENLYKAVRGVTRFYISNDDYLKLCIPIPPIEVQNEIVKLFNIFNELEETIEIELDKRKKQYKYWLEKLLNKDGREMKLSDVSNIIDSLHATPNYTSFGYPMIRVSDIKSGYVNTRGALKVNEDTFKKFTTKYKPQKDDIIISRVGSFGNVCMVGSEEICLGQNTSIIHPKINNKYLYYYLSSNKVQEWIQNNVNGAGYKSLSLANIKEIPVIIPDEIYQQRVVTILDKFNKLISNTEEGLLAEINLRKKQYEYYRNKLLKFKEVNTNG